MSARPPSLTPKGSKFGIIRHSLSTFRALKLLRYTWSRGKVTRFNHVTNMGNTLIIYSEITELSVLYHTSNSFKLCMPYGQTNQILNATWFCNCTQIRCTTYIINICWTYMTVTILELFYHCNHHFKMLQMGRSW